MAGRRKGMEWWNEAMAWGVPAWGLSLPFAWTQFASTSVRGKGGGSGQLLQLIFNLWQMLRTEGRGRAAAYRRKSSKNKIELIETKSALLTKKALVQRGMTWVEPLGSGERKELCSTLESLLQTCPSSPAPALLLLHPTSTVISAVHFHFHLQYQWMQFG